MLSGTGDSGASLGLSVAAGSSGSATVAAGATASLAIGGAGMSGTASLTCTGAPAGATCSVPATVTISASAPSNFTLLRMANALNRSVPAFREAQRLLENEESVLGRVVRRANRPLT